MGMKKIFILGTTEYAFMLNKMITQEDAFHILGHTCNASQVEDNREVCATHGVELFAFEELPAIEEKVCILNAIGYSHMNDTRKRLFQDCIERGYEPVNYISNRAIVLSEIEGRGNIVFPGAYIGTNVKVGEGNVFYTGAVMTHDIVVQDFNFIAANTTVGGVVSIGSNCFIGMGSTIRNRIHISDYTLVGAGAYLDHSTNREDVVVPARSVVLDRKSMEMSLTK